MGNTDWLTAIAVVVSGLLVGLMVIRHVYLSSRPRSTDVTTPISLVDLEAKRDSLFQQLRELDDTSSKLDSQQLARRRAELEIEAAKTLRDLDRISAAPSGVAFEPMPARPTSSVAGFIWGMAATLVIVGIVMFVNSSAKQRAPSGAVTGNLPNETQQPADDLRRLESLVAQNPENLEARLELAQTQLYRENLAEVAKQSSYVLERSPGHPRALAFQAFVRMAVGEEQVAIGLLEQALGTDPNLLDAWIYLALVRMRMGEAEKAIEAIGEAKRRHPEQAAMLDQLLAEMQSRARASPAPAENEVAGTIELDESRIAAGVTGKVLFIIARAEGLTSGPPLAVKRVVADSFPLAFRIGQADSMMGQPLPDQLRLEARIDSDGNPMTKERNDPAGFVDRVTLGSSNVRLVLR